MKSATLTVPICVLSLLSTVFLKDATAEENSGSRSSAGEFGSNDQDPAVMLRDIEARRAQHDALLPVSPLKALHDFTDEGQDRLYRATNLRLGLSINHLFQGISDSVVSGDNWGMTTDADFIAAWDILNPGEPNRGQILAHVEGRWDYGTTGPQALGFANLSSLIGTGNAFSRYEPTFLLRNLYWEQGSPEAGWAYRVGKITPDAILATSRHITPLTTFLSNGGTGLFASGYPDSGVGAVGVWHPNETIRLLGLASDANGDRFNFGNPGAGKYYTALEVGAKIAPKTDKAGYSKLTVWRQPETGKVINGQTGLEGWGVTVKHEHEFTEDGRAVGILRWGRSWKDAAAYKQQAGAHFVYYDPALIGSIENDIVGTAFNWATPNDNSGGRDEYNLEVFYRFPLFPGLDTTLSYQSVFDPAFNTEFDHAHVFSLRLRSVF